MKARFAIAAIAALTLYVSSPIASGQTTIIESATAVLLPDVPGQSINAPQLTPAQHQMLYQGYLARRHAMASLKAPLALGPSDKDMLVFSVPETVAVDTGESTDIRAPSPGSLFIGRNSAYSVVGDGRSLTAEPSIANSGAKWIGTLNWSRAYSLNSGSTSTAIPMTQAPLTHRSSAVTRTPFTTTAAM